MARSKVKSNKQSKPQTKPEKAVFSAESLTNEKAVTTAPEQIAPPLQDGGGLAELKAMEAEISGNKSATDNGSVSDGTRNENGNDTSGGSPNPRKRKFKVRPEQTFRMTLRQYWRLRDWMARRSLGLPDSYAGIFVTGKDAQLVEPLVEPVIGILETYYPDAIVFIEEKSPLLQLFIALAEVEQCFGAAVSQAKKELAGNNQTEQPNTKAPETSRPSFPSLNQTTGGKL